MNSLLLAELSPIQWGGLVFILLGGLIALAIFANYASLWLQCKMTRAGIGLLDLSERSERFRSARRNY